MLISARLKPTEPEINYLRPISSRKALRATYNPRGLRYRGSASVRGSDGRGGEESEDEDEDEDGRGEEVGLYVLGELLKKPETANLPKLIVPIIPRTASNVNYPGNAPSPLPSRLTPSRRASRLMATFRGRVLYRVGYDLFGIDIAVASPEVDGVASGYIEEEGVLELGTAVETYEYLYETGKAEDGDERKRKEGYIAASLGDPYKGTVGLVEG
ncbi:hypothetical protein QBC39DRAFT_335323 [Podospora conica]|nr:hypothetical protein QBC39DRAFT_335323 [Schizothecium conicum]